MKPKKFAHIAALVRESRVSKTPFKQEELSKEMGLCGQSISNVERGIASVPPKRIKEIAHLLHVEPMAIIEAMINDYRDTLYYAVFAKTFESLADFKARQEKQVEILRSRQPRSKPEEKEGQDE